MATFMHVVIIFYNFYNFHFNIVLLTYIIFQRFDNTKKMVLIFVILNINYILKKIWLLFLKGK